MRMTEGIELFKEAVPEKRDRLFKLILKKFRLSFHMVLSFVNGTVFYKYTHTVYNKMYKILIGRKRYEYKAFTHHNGYSPDLRTPKSFNEKLVNKKLYDFNPLIPVISDKWQVRNFVADRVGEEILNKVYQVTADSRTIFGFFS